MLVIGDVMVDVVVHPDGPVAIGADRRARIRALPGGSGANAAVWLASHGVRTRFAGRVGRHDHAAQTQLLAEAGVEPFLAADDALPTGTVVALISPDGERSFLTDRGANRHLCAGDLPGTLLDGVDLLHVSAYALFEPGPRSAVLALSKAARHRGLTTSIDMASHSFLAEAGCADVLAWTGGVRICFANSAEAAVLTGSPDPDAQLRALLQCFEIVVIKRGAEGAVAAEAGRPEHWREPALPATVVDSAGAGDAFLAGFLSTCLRGEAVPACLRSAVAAGAQAVAVAGARPNPALARGLLQPRR